MSFRFDHPELLLLLLLAVPITWLGMRSMAALDRPRRWTAIALRLAVLLIITLMLAGLQAVRRHSDLTVIAVVDQSESIRRLAKPPPLLDASPQTVEPTPSIEQWLRDWLAQAGRDRRSNDRFALIAYDGRPAVRVMPQPGLELDAGAIDQPTEGTDTAAAIRAALALFPPDTGARMLLISDGNDTAASGARAGGSRSAAVGNLGSPDADAAAVLAAAREAAAAGIPIDVLPLFYRVDSEVTVEGVYAPIDAREGQTVALRVALRATQPTAGVLQLLHDELIVDLNGDQPGTGAPITEADWTQETEGDDHAGRFVTVRQIDLPLASTGPHRYQAVFEPAAPQADAIAVNNQAQAFTLVAGKGRILFVDNVGGESGAILPRALTNHGIELDVVPPTALPGSLGQLQRYDAVILQNVPADMVNAAQQQALTRYVHELGGGLIMVGGPDSFGAGGWTNSPVDRILPVNCEIPSQTILPSGALVLVIDRSGSMASPVAGSSHTQQELANEAAVLALNTLYPQDLIGVVAFDYSAKLVVQLQLNKDPAAVAQQVRSIQPEGGTNIYAGLEMAYQQLANVTLQDAAVKHIILLTDGQSTEPEPGGYIRLVRSMMQANITLSTIGVGDGHDAQLLSQLAQMGGGRYHPILNPNNLPQVFIKEAKTIRKNLIKEITFQPTLRTTGSPITAHLRAVPALQGFVLTGPKHDPRVFMPMVGPEGEPIFAHWQVGLGRTAAFTSDATNRWATAWLGWGGYADFWARTVRAIARPSASRRADLITAIHGRTLHLRLDAADPDAGPDSTGFSNFLDVRGVILAPDGSTQQVTLHQTGPGLYQASVPVQQTGNYIVSLFLQQPDGQRQVIFGGATLPAGQELRRFESNLPLLQQIAQITGGRLIDPAAPPPGLFARTQEFESRSIRPLWRTLLPWLIALFLLDVAARRIAWDAQAIGAWIKARIGALKPRQVQAEATLDALKRRRAQADQQLAAAAAEPPAPSPASSRKFEAAPDATAQEDFDQAVGGARLSPPPQPATPSPASSSADQDQTDTTRRLLDAKRRTRRSIQGPD